MDSREVARYLRENPKFFEDHADEIAEIFVPHPHGGHAIPIAERHHDYLHDVAQRLRGHGVRVEVDESDDRMQKKIRNAQMQKVPFMLIAGDRDVEEGAISFRYRSGEQENGVSVEDAVSRVVSAVERRIQV